ncbi:unnamed protein product [Prunus armeniaca]|uniref:Uncharacterized protein n=1 Tax=Prunus armeniaca TaxID=36596 RepID=A0A6J5V9T5_PRUAR|nr:unnamed protein product [Prunus armeniaca]
MIRPLRTEPKAPTTTTILRTGSKTLKEDEDEAEVTVGIMEKIQVVLLIGIPTTIMVGPPPVTKAGRIVVLTAILNF